MLPWLIAGVAIMAFGATFSELERLRVRFGEVTRHKFHDHQDVRQAMIRMALSNLDQPIVVMGDSLTEMARFPETICGKPVVNAGVGGATISDFNFLAPRLLDGVTPSLVVVALGANDAGSLTVQRDYSALVSKLGKLAPILIAMPAVGLGAAEVNGAIDAALEGEKVSLVEVTIKDGFLKDGIHLSATGYKTWTPAIVASVSNAFGCKIAQQQRSLEAQ